MPNWAEGSLKLRGRSENIAYDNYQWEVPFRNLGG